MQIVVMGSLYQNHFGDPGHPYFACCFVEQYGPTFTPNAGGITTVPTSLPMVEQPTPAPDDFVTNARGDFLALSVLAPNVRIPANVDGTSAYSGFAPAPSPGNPPAPSPNPIFPTTNNFGAHIMMNADLDPGGGGGIPGGGGGGGGGANPVPQGNPLTIANGGNLLGTTASIPLTCVLTTACDGLLQLTNRATGTLAAAKKKAKVYGKRRFSIPAGKTENVKVKLNKAGKKRLGKRKALTLTATATLGSQTVSSRVKLKRRGGKK